MQQDRLSLEERDVFNFHCQGRFRLARVIRGKRYLLIKRFPRRRHRHRKINFTFATRRHFLRFHRGRRAATSGRGLVQPQNRLTCVSEEKRAGHTLHLGRFTEIEDRSFECDLWACGACGEAGSSDDQDVYLPYRPFPVET